MTGNEIIKAALRKLGVLAVSEVPDADQYASGLEALNDLIDSLSIDGATVFTTQASTFSLSAGKQTYTIGKDPSASPTIADFDVARPSRITEANLIVAGLRYALDIYDDEKWSAIAYRSFGAQPKAIYPDGNYPLMNLSLYPYPSDASYQLELYTWSALTQFTNGATKYYFPPGYARMLKLLLAVELAPDYDREPTPQLQRNAADALAKVQNLNLETPMLALDPAVLPTGRGGRTQLGWLGNYQ